MMNNEPKNTKNENSRRRERKENDDDVGAGDDGGGDGVGGWIYEDGVDEVGKNIFLSICIGVRLEG